MARLVAVLERLKEGSLPQTIKVDNVLPAKASRRLGDSRRYRRTLPRLLSKSSESLPSTSK
jgi:hypothetical protein